MSPHREQNDEDTPTEPSMSAQEQARILRKWDRFMFGDKYHQDTEPGFATFMTRMSEDYYGNREKGIVGTRDKINWLWEKKLQIVAIFGVITVLTPVVGWVIDHWRK